MTRNRLFFNDKGAAWRLLSKGSLGATSGHGVPEPQAKQRSEPYDRDKTRCAVGSDAVIWTVCNSCACSGQYKRPDRRAAASGCVLSSDDGLNAGAADVRCSGCPLRHLFRQRALLLSSWRALVLGTGIRRTVDLRGGGNT